MSSSWNLSHPAKRHWIKIQKTYYMTKTSCNWGKMNLITSISWMRPSKAYFHDFHLRNFCWWLFVTWKRSSRTWLSHPSSPHLWLRWKFFEKIRNMFLHHLVALRSCNTRFEGEKWKLSQLKYSGEMQLFQKDFDKEKTSVDALLARNTYTEFRKTFQSSILIQEPFLRIFNHKTYLSYIHKHSGSQQSTKHTQNTGNHTNHQYWSRMYQFWEISIIKHIWAIFRL